MCTNYLRHSSLFKALLWLGLGFIATSCAQQAAPQGGPRDEVPPEVVRTTPATGSLNVRGREILIRFSEPIRKPTFDKEIFISPLVQRPDIKLSDNAKRLTIKFSDDLRPQTTYIITLNGVKDNNESNDLAAPYVLAFSTGDVLDSLSFRGHIWMPTLGKGAEEMTVLLFDADSAIGNDFLGKRPAYLTKTDKQGDFSFQYLRPARYRVLGLKDEDQSNTYSLPTELIAISPDTIFTLSPPEPDTTLIGQDTLAVPTDTLVKSDSLPPLPSDSLGLDTLAADSLPNDSSLQDSSLSPPKQKPDIELYAFIPDNTGPQLRSYDLLTPQTLSLSLSEWPREDRIAVWESDTTRADSSEIQALTLYKEEQNAKLLVHFERPLPIDLHIRNLSDSLGNGIDTVLRVTEKPLRKIERPILSPPELEAAEDRWKVLLPRIWQDSLASYVQLTDTAKADSNRKTFDLAYKGEDFYLNLAPGTLPDATAPYLLKMQGLIGAMKDSSLYDSLFTFQLKWFDVADYGSLQGGITVDSIYTGPIWVQILDNSGKVVAAQSDTAFFFPRLLAGDYSFRVILDEDSNQAWTPGQLSPLRMPERIYEVPEKVSLRANWDFEGHRVVVKVRDEDVKPTASTKGKQAQGGKQGEVPGEGEARPGGRQGPGIGRRP